MVTDGFCYTRPHFTILSLDREGDLRKRRWQEGEGGDYLSRRLIEGQLLFEEIRYALFVLF